MNVDKEREYQIKLLIERARYYKLLDDTCPDVGWGKSFLSCLADAQKDFGYTHIDIKKVCDDSI